VQQAVAVDDKNTFLGSCLQELLRGDNALEVRGQMGGNTQYSSTH
jgi:hypothetical protein